MNDLGYEANNVSQTFLLDNSACGATKTPTKSNPEEKQATVEPFENSSGNTPDLQSKLTVKFKIPSELKKKMSKLDVDVA